MTSIPARLLFFAIAAVAGWIFVTAYAGRLFLACLAIATWRLWRVARGAPLPGSPHDLYKIVR
jgi:hypothetical protein